MIVDYETYKMQNFTCIKCGWEGKGEQLSNGDFSEMHSIGNLDCPKCFHLIAFWQAPLTNNESDN